MDYLEKITEIEELTKLFVNNIPINKTFDLIFKKCQELRELLSNYYIE